MARCTVCGNDYDKSFEVTYLGEKYTFDSIECAAFLVAPTCEHCGCRILGHGVENNGSMYCCAHCAREMGVTEIRDRSDQPIGQGDLGS